MKTQKLFTQSMIALIVAGLMAAPMAAQAAVGFAPFASFSNGFFTFTNIPAGSSAASGIFVNQSPTLPPVNFTFLENVSSGPSTYLAGQAINGITVTLVASTNGVASSTVLTSTKTYLDQPIVDQSSTPGDLALKFTNSLGQNLLTISTFTGDLSGFSGGGTASLDSDTSATTLPDILTYSSDFLTFSSPHQGSDDIGLTLTGGTRLTRNADGYLDTFNAIGDGTFSSPPVSAPEPSGIVSLSVLGGCLMLCAARRRKSLLA